MATGSYWNVDNPLKPWGYFDPDSALDFPIEWTEWLADRGATYGSHQIICETPLQCLTSSESLGIVTARVSATDPSQLQVGKKYAVTCRLTTAGGEIEDQTVYLKVREK